MDCKTLVVHKFKRRLGFKLHNVILTNKQSLLTKMISLFGGENIQNQYSVYKNIFASLFSVDNIVSLSRHEKVC